MDSSSAPVFRASKRRKINLRKRAESSEEADTNLSTSVAPQQPQSPPPSLSPDEASQRASAGQEHTPDTAEAQAEAEDVPIFEILRRRQQLGKARKSGGIAFTTSKSASSAPRSAGETPQPSDENAVARPGQMAVTDFMGRFKPQTGQLTEVVDKHMMAYIDSKMAELRNGQGNASHKSGTGAQQPLLSAAAREELRQRQPASVGKLQEVDLGPDATMRNILRTEAAKRKLETGQEVEVEEKGSGKKVRLRKDGTVWKPRNRRNSADLARDQMVEELMREPTSSEAYNDQAADDHIAEQFKREFLAAVESKNIRKTQPMPPGPPGSKPGEERAKGPKLGGSRSARAAMAKLEAEKAKKK